MNGIIDSVLRQLNEIEIKGKPNIMRMQFCMSTLEQLKVAIQETPATSDDHKKEDAKHD